MKWQNIIIIKKIWPIELDRISETYISKIEKKLEKLKEKEYKLKLQIYSETKIYNTKTYEKEEIEKKKKDWNEILVEFINEDLENYQIDEEENEKENEEWNTRILTVSWQEKEEEEKKEKIVKLQTYKNMEVEIKDLVIKNYATIDIKKEEKKEVEGIVIKWKKEQYKWIRTDYEKEKEMIKEVWEKIKEKNIKLIYIHDYNTKKIEWLLNQKNQKEKIKTEKKEPIIIDNKIIQIELNYKEHKFKIRNTERIWEMTQKELFELHEKERKAKEGNIEEELEINTNNLEEILKEFQETIYKRVKMDPLTKNTLPGIGSKAWKVLDKESIKELTIIPQNTEIGKNIRKAYYSGLNEIYIPKIEKGIILDVNSLYPTVMWKKKLPTGQPIKLESKKIEDYYGYCLAKIKTPKNMKKGILPYRYKNKTITPEGEWTGWYYSEELKEVKKYGYSIEVIKGYHFEKKKNLFNNFIKVFSDMKQNGEKKWERKIAKKILNSVYGYLGIKKKEEDEKNTEKEIPWWTRHLINIAVAAAISGEGRIFMIPYLQEKKLAYTDTDSLIIEETEDKTEIEIEKEYNLKLHPTKLKTFKKEGNISDAYFFKKKTYIYIKENKKIVKASGISKKFITYDEFKKLHTDNIPIIKGIILPSKTTNKKTYLKINNNITHARKVLNPEGKWIATAPPLLTNIDNFEQLNISNIQTLFQTSNEYYSSN